MYYVQIEKNTVGESQQCVFITLNHSLPKIDIENHMLNIQPKLYKINSRVVCGLQYRFIMNLLLTYQIYNTIEIIKHNKKILFGNHDLQF